MPSNIVPITDRVHSSFNQTMTATGRLSTSNPNFQNIPIRTEDGKEIRKAIKAQSNDYQIFSADYSQVELRVMAHLSGDESLIAALNNGEDIHTFTAKNIFNVEDDDQVLPEMRRIAKIVNFGIMYGAGPFRLSQELDVPFGEAKKIKDAYFDKYKGIDSKILLKEVSYSNIADTNDPISISVSENNFKPILAAFEIKNSDEDSYLIDVTAYFMSDSPGFNIIRSYDKENYKIGGVDKKRSFIDSAKSFPQNIEVLHTLTFSANKAPRKNQTKSFSFQINHSIIALPDDLMPIRYEDERVGWFNTEKINYSSNALKSDKFSIVRRWRLEPSDLDAYKKGVIVEPIKPIVYYLDPATPIKWRKYFKMGIEDWNTAFEKAGFKNAIIAKDPPTKEEDPNFSAEDIRYSTVRYVASTTRNAVGPSVSDPRTGEILESDIIWYHNHLRSCLLYTSPSPRDRG